MTNNNEITAVMFRKERDGGILAVFPYESWRHNRQITCYAHVGQHHSCIWEYVKNDTLPATQEEYKTLYQELVSLGYNLRVITTKYPSFSRMYKL